MLAIAALIMFIVALVVHGLTGWVGWMLLGFILLAADAVFTGWESYPFRFGRARS